MAQTRTITSSGNWSNSGNWQGGNIGGAVDNNDDVVMNNDIDITIQNGETYTIATLDVSKDGSLTIDVGGILTVTGSVNVDKDFTINVDGDLIIEGDLLVAKSLQLNVTGNLTILGNVDVAKDAQLDVQGAMAIGGDFTSAKDAQVNVDGTLDITGDLDLGDGSVITGSGTVTNGSCSGAACGDSQILPVELIYFTAASSGDKVNLTWATASEENFDYFSIERSFDGTNFNEIAQISGTGFSSERVDYEYTDETPAAGKSYYRLRSNDFDGYSEIFDYAIVDVEGMDKQANVFPNPVTDGTLNIQLNFDVEEATVLIYNNMGSVELSLSLNSWLNSFDVSVLQSGSYLVKVISKENAFVTRILVK